MGSCLHIVPPSYCCFINRHQGFYRYFLVVLRWCNCLSFTVKSSVIKCLSITCYLCNNSLVLSVGLQNAEFQCVLCQAPMLSTVIITSAQVYQIAVLKCYGLRNLFLKAANKFGVSLFFVVVLGPPMSTPFPRQLLYRVKNITQKGYF